MAIPTVFGPFTAPVANTSTVFRLSSDTGTTLYGVDTGGTLTPSAVPLAPGMIVFMDSAYSTAVIVAAMQAFMRRVALQHDGAGGYPAINASTQVLPTKTVCT